MNKLKLFLCLCLLLIVVGCDCPSQQCGLTPGSTVWVATEEGGRPRKRVVIVPSNGCVEVPCGGEIQIPQQPQQQQNQL
jgi:hypothetical protein